MVGRTWVTHPSARWDGGGLSETNHPTSATEGKTGASRGRQGSVSHVSVMGKMLGRQSRSYNSKNQDKALWSSKDRGTVPGRKAAWGRAACRLSPRAPL